MVKGMNYKKCAWCGKYIYSDNKKLKYCSRDCSGKAIAYNRQKAVFDDKTLEQIAKEAADLGLSYGQYIGHELARLQSWKRRNK